MPAILSFGEPLYEFSEVEEEGAPRYLPGFGGDTSNVAIAAARQGAEVGVLARVGKDAFGARFIELWRSEGIDTSSVQIDDEAPTGIYLISYGEDGHQFSYFRSGSAASLVRPGDLPARTIASARILHLSGISQAISDSACDAAFAAIEIARDAGVLVSYDTNLRLKLWPLARARAILLASVALSDFCLASYDDAVQLTGRSDPHEIVEALLDTGARCVALKLGARGVLVAEGTQREVVPGLTVDAVDATGAGDTFDGAFLAELLEGRSPFEAARYANAAAALSTRGYGAVSPIPRRPEVERFLTSSA